MLLTMTFLAVAAKPNFATHLLLDDPIKLTRIFKADEVDQYTFSATDKGSMGIKADGKLKVKTGKPADKLTPMTLSFEGLKVEMNGNAVDHDLGDFEAKWNNHGWPNAFTFHDADTLFSLFAFSNFLPEGDLTAGTANKIDWKSEDKSIAIKGSITLKSIEVKDGAKIATLTESLDITPEKDGEGHVDATYRVAVDTGKLISTEGKLAVQEIELSFKFEKAK